MRRGFRVDKLGNTIFSSIHIFLICLLLPMSVNATNPIIIAINTAETGIEVEGDRGIISGVKLAIKKINSDGGVLGRPLKIQFIDNFGTDIGARNSALKAIDTKAVAMIGAGRSSRTLAAAKVLQKNNMPLISPYSTHPEITKIGNHIFRVGFTDDFQGKKLGEFAAHYLKAKNAVILINGSEKYSTTLASNFTKSFTNLKNTVVWNGYYYRTTMDFSSLFEEIKNLKYDLIFIPGYSKRSAWIIKQARKSGVKSLFMGGDGWGLSMFGFAGEYMTGQLSADHWHRDIATPQSRQFIQQYKEEIGTDFILSTGTALAYDSVNLIAQAIQRSGDASRTGVQKGLYSLQGFHGVTGLIEFNQNGDPKHKNIVLTKFENSNKILIGVLNQTIDKLSQ